MGEWLDPSRSALTLDRWIEQWLPSRRADLRSTSFQRLEQVIESHVLPRFGKRRLSTITNAEVRRWVAELQAGDEAAERKPLSAASTRKATFALRSALDAAVADRRLSVNPAANVPLPSERAAEQRFLSREEVDALAEAIDPAYRDVVLLGALCGLRWGEIAGLRRSRVDVLRSRLTIDQTAVQVDGEGISFGEPKTKGSRRTIPVARSVMAEIEAHLMERVGPEPDALLVTGPDGGPMHRGTFWRIAWKPALKTCGLQGLREHDLRHTYVSLLIASGANVKQVSQWAGHSSVTVTLDVYAHLMHDDGDDIADRMDALLGARSEGAQVRSIGG
ncbi:tyrosine-type recombinase/integrase [Aeromicrobium sp. CF4.19]|uniref:tyrosine-type recombinase/integrase n=1 Tax=Aeromicrobium sp. CF4.19 TaxID=3373082 RepID=UPI003EE4ADE7